MRKYYAVGANTVLYLILGANGTVLRTLKINWSAVLVDSSVRLHPHPFCGFAFAKAFDLFGIAHLTEDLFDHDTAYVRAFLLDIGNAELTELLINHRFDNAGLGSPGWLRVTGAFFEFLVCGNNSPQEIIEPRQDIMLSFMPML